jgi:arginine-tRNA-protein transferase
MQTGKTRKFPPVFYARYQVERLSPDDTDELLANGWFRNDVSVCASCARYVGDQWHSSLMLRLPLKNFSWKKRLSKLLRRNSSRFRVQIRPFQPSEEKEILWENFKKQVHLWEFVPTLKTHLFKRNPPENYPSWEVGVYDDTKLVAFSIFDIGKKSLASLEAAYHPDYHPHSLGIYTMLLEIDYSISLGLSHYYPGFLPKDVPMFHYKLRPGGLEFFRLREQRWLPWEKAEPEDWLHDQVLLQLGKLKESLQSFQVFAAIGYGLHTWEPANQISAARYNVFLVVKKSAEAVKWDYLIAWDVMEEKYYLFSAPPDETAVFPLYQTASESMITIVLFLMERIKT